jgi:hypothetical protein
VMGDGPPEPLLLGQGLLERTSPERTSPEGVLRSERVLRRYLAHTSMQDPSEINMPRFASPPRYSHVQAGQNSIVLQAAAEALPLRRSLPRALPNLKIY